MSDTCKSCHATIIWTVSSKGGRMPLDALPVPDGNIIIDGEVRYYTGEMMPASFVLTGGDVPLGDPPRYVTHFATCPDAKTWRNR